MTAVIEKPKHVTQAVNDILHILDAFGALLTYETTALKDADFAAVDRLQPEKREFARLYESMVQGLNARRDEMKMIDLATRESLIIARTRFTLILNDNMRTLELVKRSTQRLANRILEVARAAVTQDCQTNYSSKGQMQTYKTSSMSMRIDETL